jgi:multiple sugar transport system substrate-binding protein
VRTIPLLPSSLLHKKNLFHTHHYRVLMCLTVGAAMLSTALSLAGAPDATASNAKTTITIAYGSTYVFDTNQLANAFWGNLQKQFDAQNPGAHLQLVPIPGSYTDIINKLSLMYRSGNPPDLAELPTAQIGLWAQAGYLKPLNSFLRSATWWRHFPKVVQSEGAFGGKVYAVNHGENTSLLYYNKDILAKSGVKIPWVPKNWTQILTSAESVERHDKNVIPLWLAAGTGSGTNGILQGGGNLIDGCPVPTIYQKSTGKWVVDSPCLRSVFAFYLQVYKNGLGAPVSDLFSPSAVTTPLTLFKQGKLAIAVGSNYYGGAWQPSICGPCWAGASKVMRTAPIPTQYGQAPGVASTLGGWDIAMAARTKDPGLAWKVINLLESERFIVDAANWAGFVPPNVSYATAPGYAGFAPPYQVAAAKVLPYATLTPSQAAYTEWGHAFEVATGDIASHPQSMTVDKAIAAMKSDAEASLGPGMVTTIK